MSTVAGLGRMATVAVLGATLLSSVGCVTTETLTPVSAARADAAPAQRRASDEPIRIPGTSGIPSGRWGVPSAQAPAELAQFGQFAGRWECTVEDRDARGRWQTRPDTATWTWFYALGGLAVQDVWEPRRSGGMPVVLGTNLRLYDRDAGVWRAMWTSTDEARFELWQGAASGSRIVMLHGGDDGASRRIEFYDLTPDAFAWHYELRRSDDWQVALRSRCRRTAG